MFRQLSVRRWGFFLIIRDFFLAEITKVSHISVFAAVIIHRKFQHQIELISFEKLVAKLYCLHLTDNVFSCRYL